MSTGPHGFGGHFKPKTRCLDEVRHAAEPAPCASDRLVLDLILYRGVYMTREDAAAAAKA